MTQRQWWGTTLAAADTFTDVAPGTGALYKAIEIDGSYANEGFQAYGIIQYPANSGEHVTVGWHGEMKFVAGAAIARGQRLTPTTSGYFVTADSGDAVVGRCAELAVGSGAVGRGLFNFSQPSIFQNSYDELGVFAFDAAADLSAAATVGLAIASNSGNLAVLEGGYGNGILVTGATSGGTCTAKFMGIVRARAGGVIVEGDAVQVIGTSMLTQADSGDVAIGRALEASAAGNSGGLFLAMVNFATPVYAHVASHLIINA